MLDLLVLQKLHVRVILLVLWLPLADKPLYQRSSSTTRENLQTAIIDFVWGNGLRKLITALSNGSNTPFVWKGT